MEFLETDRNLAAGAYQFATTHWTVVLTAGQQSSPQAEAALAELCRTYWYPLYAYVRRRGYHAPDAQDLTQAFFAQFFPVSPALNRVAREIMIEEKAGESELNHNEARQQRQPWRLGRATQRFD